jgi:PIN domain nuclease of toxin-antitoxin system
MSKSILDASAFLAYLGNEPGATKVQDAIANGALMSTVNFSEVLSKLGDRGVDIRQASEDFRSSGLIGGAIKLVDFIAEDSENVAMLRPKTKSIGLSLADRACLALGLRLNLPVWTADRSWLGLKISVAIRAVRG